MPFLIYKFYEKYIYKYFIAILLKVASLPLETHIQTSRK